MNAQQLMDRQRHALQVDDMELLDEATLVDPRNGVDVQVVMYAIDHTPDPDHDWPGYRQVRVAMGSDAEGFGGASLILYEETTTQPED